MKHTVINLIEGSPFKLNEDQASLFREYIHRTPGLPIKLQGNTLIFDDYTIGSITVGNLSLIINPRISYLTTNNYFEMQLYNEGIISNNLVTLLGENTSYGLENSLVSMFIKQCLLLVNKGLEGRFTNHVDITNVIHGRILVDKINPIDLLRDRLPVQYSIHSLQTVENKLIKLALDKCRLLIHDKEQNNALSIVNASFEDISVVPSDYMMLVSKLKSEYSTYVNKHYPTVISLARKILDNIKLNMKDNKILGSSYLVNSNNLFESYGRKVLKDGLRTKVEKWKQPRPMAKFNYKSNSYIKSYIPDILINYLPSKDITYALLDTKNKDISDLQNAAKLPDLYQVIFYTQKLQARFAGLVYPSDRELPPLKVNIEGFNQLNFYIFTIDFSKSLKLRNRTYIDQVKQTFHI